MSWCCYLFIGRCIATDSHSLLCFRDVSGRLSLQTVETARSSARFFYFILL